MEQKSLWKNFLLLTIGGLFVLHMNVVEASEQTSSGTTTQTSTSTDDCVLEAE